MPSRIRSMHLEHVLRDVQTDRVSLLHGRLLRWQFDTVTLAHRCRRGASTPSPDLAVALSRRERRLRGNPSRSSTAGLAAVQRRKRKLAECGACPVRADQELRARLSLRNFRAVVPSRGASLLRYLTCSMNARSFGKTWRLPGWYRKTPGVVTA